MHGAVAVAMNTRDKVCEWRLVLAQRLYLCCVAARSASMSGRARERQWNMFTSARVLPCHNTLEELVSFYRRSLRRSTATLRKAALGGWSLEYKRFKYLKGRPVFQTCSDNASSLRSLECKRSRPANLLVLALLVLIIAL